MSKASRILVAAAAVLTLAGCGGGYNSTAAVFEDLAAMGFPCGTDEIESGSTEYAAEAACDYELPSTGKVDTLTVTIYEGEGSQDFAKTMVGAFADFAPAETIWGDGWSVSLDDRNNAEAIAEELDGELA